jgi:hypothetical protein
MTHAAIASRAVPKPTTKPKKGEPFKLHVILPGEMVDMIDAYAKKMTRDMPFERPRTRTDAMKAVLVEGLKSLGVIK